MRDGIITYICDGRPTGSFLEHVISNQLFEALDFADDLNIHVLPVYAAFFYNEAPRECFGSPQRYKDWIKQKGMRIGMSSVISEVKN